MADKKVCSICGKEFDGFGNNAKPVNDGVCCDKCNAEVVIPRRMEECMAGKKQDDVNNEDYVDDNAKKFLRQLADAKYGMMKQNMIDIINNDGKPASEEEVGKLFHKTTENLVDAAKKYLSKDVLNSIINKYYDIVSDDISSIFQLYKIAEMDNGRSSSDVECEVVMLVIDSL